MPNLAFVNGTWSSLEDAKISIEDRGFQFGDGVYEVIRTYGRAIFGLSEHLARLKISADEIEISLPYSPSELESFIRQGCLDSQHKDTSIYIQLTRGVAPRSHAFPKGVQSTLVMTFRETTRIPTALREKGVSVISVPDMRWGRCHVKSLNLLPNVLAREEALRSGAYEAILVRDGIVTEGAGSNLFAVSGKKIMTTPIGASILSGITRKIVFQMGLEEGLDMRECPLVLEDLYRADELFITGTTVEVLPVVELDGKKIASGRPGKMTSLLQEAFQKYVQGKRTCKDSRVVKD